MEIPSDEELDAEELQLDYDEKCDEVVDLQRELRAAKLEGQQLQLRLTAQNNKAPAAQVQKMPVVAPVDPKYAEMENFIRWLGQHACLDRAEEFDVDLEVPIGSHSVHMHRVVQWPLTFKTRRHLKLTAPIEFKQDLQELLTLARSHNGALDTQVLHSWVNSWDLVPGDLETATQKDKEQVVLLVHRSSKEGILVASWPTVGALEAFRALCSTDGEPFTVGERVEVEFDGKWYAGILRSLTITGKATVSCDIDEPGVLTFAPVYRLRREGPPKRTRCLSLPGQALTPCYEEPEGLNRPRCQSLG
jgi:hypothetical protein